MFHGKIPEGSVATWIIVLAIICGILILFLIATALHKVRLRELKHFSAFVYKTRPFEMFLKRSMYLTFPNTIFPTTATYSFK
jgi:hypothetical protein